MYESAEKMGNAVKRTTDLVERSYAISSHKNYLAELICLAKELEKITSF